MNVKVELTESELMTIHRPCDYIISRRTTSIYVHQAGIIAKAEALDDKVEQILYRGDE